MTKEQSIALYQIGGAFLQVCFGLSVATLSKEGIGGASYEVYQIVSIAGIMVSLVASTAIANEKISAFLCKHAQAVVLVDCVLFLVICAITAISNDPVVRWCCTVVAMGSTACMTNMLWEQIKQDSGSGRAMDSVFSMFIQFGIVIGMGLSLFLSLVFGFKPTVAQAVWVEVIGCVVESTTMLIMVRKTICAKQ